MTGNDLQPTPRTDAVWNAEYGSNAELGSEARMLSEQLERDLAEAFEEAAKVCDARLDVIDEKNARNPNGESAYAAGARNEAIYCAIEIRALKPKQPYKGGAELTILRTVLLRAREALLVGIKGTPDDLGRALGQLNLACRAHWDWETSKIARIGQQP